MIDFSELIEPTVEILKNSEEGLYIKDINKMLEQKVNISEKDLEKKHADSTQSEFSYRAAWARTYLKKYGLIQNPERGFWKISANYTGELVKARDVVESVQSQRAYRSAEEEMKTCDIAAENEKYIKELSVEYRLHNVALFLGAGVSIAANMPSWNELVAKFLVERIKEENTGKLDRKIRENLERIAEENREASPLMQTRFMKQNMKPEEYFKLLMKAIYQTEENIDNELFESLMKLIRKENELYIKDIVTYNFDDLLEKKLKQKDIYYESFDKYMDKKSEKSVKLYHVHGYLDRQAQPDELDLDRIIFAEEQYHNMYEDTYNWSNMQQINMLREKTGLFIGCSLTDPNMRRVADIAYKVTESRHYAILKREEIRCPENILPEDKAYKLYQDFYWHNRNAYYNSLGIHVIWIDNYDEIPNILERIGRE